MSSESKGTTLRLQDLIKLRLHAQTSRSSRTLNNPWVGDRRAVNRGRGMDFDGVRVYQPGDDTRVMDWKVTARTNSPHIKIYKEERERPVYILLDLCESMHFGTRVAFKSVIASKLAAMLAWRAYSNGDRVGGIVFNDQEHRHCHPHPQQRGVLSFLKHVVDITNAKSHGGHSDMFTLQLQTLQRIVKPGSVVILISDFYNFSDAARLQLQYLSSRQQIESFLVYDPLEAELPATGCYEFVSDGQRIKVDSLNKKLKSRYHEQFVLKLSEFTRWHYQYKMGFSSVATNDNLKDIVNGVKTSVRIN